MRLRLRLPEVREGEYEVPQECPYGCGGRYYALHQECRKAVSDPAIAGSVDYIHSFLACILYGTSRSD